MSVRMRDTVATIFVLILVVALAIGIMIAMGKPVPLIGRFLGQ
ncbi:MAG TPA: hypothetical protein PLO37_25475 [Candidatus Hydrogenedentes bacterium]|nr:hypothetical protein [Candidatus Hydrogenedentota bacterium]HPG70209.1 hypothetical protein [Candidatus Hydrogenedentota bacterium]